MINFSSHAKWQATHYNEHPPLNPFEMYQRTIGFAKTVRPKDLAMKQYFNSFKIGHDTKILDLGCASGILLQRIRTTYDSQGTGIDVSNILIEKAKQHDTKNEYYIADAAQLPFADNTFDLVTSIDNLEHIKEYKQVIKEISRVLKPGGILMLNTINKNNKYTFDWLLEKMGSTYHLDRAGHVKELFFHPPDIKQLVEEAGLENVKIRLFDATATLIVDCVLYVLLMIAETIATKTKTYTQVARYSLATTDVLSKLLLPITETIDLLFTKHGYSNAFFLTAQKKSTSQLT